MATAPKCPKCQTPGAYIGAFTVECRNKLCELYSWKQAAKCPCCGEDPHDLMDVDPAELDPVTGKPPPVAAPTHDPDNEPDPNQGNFGPDGSEYYEYLP